MHSYEELKKDESIRTYIEAADATLMELMEQWETAQEGI